MPSASSCFCPVFDSQKIHIKRSPNGIKLYGDFFWNICDFWASESTQTGAHGGEHAPGRAPGPWRGQGCAGHLVRRLRPFFWRKKDNFLEKNQAKESVQSELRISGYLRNGEGPESGNAKQKRTEREIQSRRGSCPSAAMAAMDQRGNPPPI